MKKIILLLSVILALNANASHQVAGDIGYKCLGNNQYEFYVYFYRDCGGISAPTALTLSGTSSCGTVSIQLNQIDLSPNDPSSFGVYDTLLLCYQNLSSCNGGIYPGMDVYKYISAPTTINPCADWSFCADDCCRNSGATFPPYTSLINFNTSTSIAFKCTLNNSDGTCDDSPVWKFPPRDYICQGFSSQINNGATDPDGDSLVYELVTSNDGCNNGIISYNPPFSATYPLSTSSGNFPFDPSTGIATVTPSVLTNSIEITVVGIKVSSFRNGVLRNTTYRDMQLTTLKDCIAFEPQIIEVSTGTKTTFLNDTFTVYAGDSLDFTAIAQDNANQNAFRMFNFLKLSLPSITFIVDTLQNNIQTGKTILLTDSSMIGTYKFHINIYDLTCPKGTSVDFKYVLQILPASANPAFSVDDKLKESFKIYPNPTENDLTIKLPEGLEKAHVSILDITGKTHQSLQLMSNSTSVKLDVPKGIYFVKIESDNNTVVKKMIVE